MLKICSFSGAAMRSLLVGGLALGAASISPAVMALTISGTPTLFILAGKPYSFRPTATDSPGKALIFKIANKPSWATFSSSTGQLSGTPPFSKVYYNVTISVSDGTSTAALPKFFIHVEPVDKTPPVISGIPPTSVKVGSSYTFQPTAKDPAGNQMGFGIRNKPSWATFNVYTGLLTGKPNSAQVGTYSNISIYVSDGQMTGSMSAFTITVTPATTTGGPGSATVKWTPPTKNTNGSALTDYAGVRIYYGTSAAKLNNVVQVASPANQYTIANLAAGTWYFAAGAYTTVGTASAMSSVVSKAIP